MSTKEPKQTHDLISDTEEHGITRVLHSHFRELMSLGPGPTSNVCKLFRNYLVSNLGLNYFTMLNLLVKSKLVANTDEGRDSICNWLDNDVMEAINGICETEVFDNPRALSALSDIVFALSASFNTIEEDIIEDEIEYLLDIPYQLSEMVKESPHVPRFYKCSFQHEERGRSEKVSIHMSERNVSVSYRIDVKT